MTVFDGVHIEALVSTTTNRYRTTGDWPNPIFDLPIMGIGISKTVYALPSGTHVLKIESPGTETKQIQTEIAVWCHAPKELEVHLAAIHDFGENWIIAERADSIHFCAETEYEQRRIIKFAEQFSGFDHSLPWYIGDIFMNEEANVGRRITDNSLCLIDYSGGYSPPDYRSW